MGKLIETKYSDVEHRIIKKSSKKDKYKKKLTAKTNDSTGKNLKPIKRKASSVSDTDEPNNKVIKIDYQDVSIKENNDILEAPEDLRQNEIIIPQFCVVKGNGSDDIRLKLKESDNSDLFFHDELRSNYENYVNKDFGFHAIDEIALEGLDGITIEAFWKRFLIGLDSPLSIDNNLKELIWGLICSNQDIQFYQLPTPRGILEIYDRFKYFDADIGVVMEMAYKLPDIYHFALVNHPNIQGSCLDFKNRTNISEEVRALTLKKAEEKYNRTLVMVATQRLRRKALFNEATDPVIELQNLEYCVLERIGRSRKHGELTQGNMSITSYFKMDPKSVFHYKKQLIQNSLLAKQFFYIKSAVTDQNKTGRLLHLKRFFHNIKPKQLLITEQICNIIKSKPGCRLEHSELKKIFPENYHTVVKVVKSQEFHKFVKTDSLYPYRALYPNAKKSEYMRKARPVEKSIRCLELTNPYINVTASWCAEQEDSDEEDDDGEEEVIESKMYNMECFREVYSHVLSKGREGCSMKDIQKLVGVDINTIRMSIKKLLGKHVIDVRKLDKGKQRHMVYYARCLENEDVKVNLKPNPPKLLSNVLFKIKKRQKATIKKAKSEQAVAKQQDTIDTSINVLAVIDIDVLHLQCPFFIKVSYESSNVVSDFYEKAEFINIPRNYLIKLNTKFHVSEKSFDVNQILLEINSTLSLPQIKINFDCSYVAKTNINHITKLILLKAALGEVIINSDTLNSLGRKRKHPGETNIPILSENGELEKSHAGDKRLQYMGESPVSVVNENDGNICVEIIVSTPPPAFIIESVYPNNKDLTERVYSRIQMVLKLVYERRIFEDIYKMVKFIEEEEVKEGYTRKIDRKSLARILYKLVQEGYIKIYKLVICDGKITKTQWFVCHPAVNHMDSMIQSAYQQLKWKYFVGTQKKTSKPHLPSVQKSVQDKIQKEGASPFKESDVMNSIAELRELNKIKYTEIKNRHNRLIGRGYGFKPKFIRMRILHEVLFYLIYCYGKYTKPLADDEVKKLFKDYRIDLTDEDLEYMPKIYCKEISWKMFIPPLPYHRGWIAGWALVCDVILRLPISVLCKIHNVTYEVPELMNILNHPIKRFYLVKDLSENIRNAALFKRKYLFDIHETMCRLAYCGLLQFGPQKYKEKDQVFIYLNRRASLLDTTTSEPAYHKVTVKEYKQLTFFFNTQVDLDNYWYNVYGISLSTKLNAKQSGQLVTLVDVSAKPELVNTIRSKVPEEVLRYDTGDIPGDKRGAAGLDSSLWSHIMRNWFWANTKVKIGNEPPPNNMGLRKERLERILPQNISYGQLHTAHANSLTNKVYLHSNTKERKDMKLKKVKKSVPIPLKTSKTIQRITRKIPYRQKKSVRQYHDHTDKMILKKSGLNTRVRWSEKEDKILMLCKVASIFLNPRFPKKQIIPYTIIRDVLHRLFPESKNKTSRACQRRLKLYVSENYPHLEDNVPNLFKIKPILECYSVLINNLLKEKSHNNKPFKLKESQLSAAFVFLMSYISQHQEEVENVLQGTLINTDHLADDNLEYVERNLVDLEDSPIKYQNANDEADIKKDILKAVIHSSLGSRSQPGWAFQLFRIYQRYPDSIIREAVGELKDSQAISFKRFVTKKEKLRWHTPFQLSNVYIYSQSTTFNITTANEAFKTFLNVKNEKKFLDFSQETIESKTYGQLLGLNEFFSIWEKFHLKFFLPQNTVILNPHIKDHSELINELAIRWHLKLKKMLQENNDPELEPETEPDNNYRSKTHETETFPTYKEGPSTSKISNQPDLTSADQYNVDDNPLDLTVDAGNSETIDRLKTWVTDCMETERERRSPSPEFINAEEYCCQTIKDMSSNLTASAEALGSVAEENKASTDEADGVQKDTVRKPLSKEDMPTLEEIEEGMLNYTPESEKRRIPYITDLSSLLNRENFTELNTDEETLERLKNHFITQYAILEDITLDEPEELEDLYLVKYLQDAVRNKKLWNRIESEIVIKEPADMSEVYELLANVEGGIQDDEFALTNEIIDFVHDKREFGATGPQIKERFKHMETGFLEKILKVLVDTGILLMTGICAVTFVHYAFESLWIVETFALSHDEQRILEEKTANVKKDVKENIDKHLESKTLVRIKVMPWTKVDGTLNDDSLKMWLCNILSHCLDYPKISFTKLCEKFCYIKPVDIYYLLEILQELDSIKVLCYETKEQCLFSSWEYTKERCATFLDNLEDLYIAPNSTSMIRMGSFFYNYEGS